MFHRLLLALSACSLAAACSAGDAQPVARKVTSNESACASYGLVPGTTAYTICVQREAEARRRGRLGPDYDQILIARDARDDCASYGLASGTPPFERCVQREISYRHPN